MIIEGRKTQTRRARRPSVKVGQTIRLRRGYTSYINHSIMVTGIYTQRLDEMKAVDFIKEGFLSLDEFRAAWIDIYGAWDPGQKIWVVEFRHINPSETFKQKTRG